MSEKLKKPDSKPNTSSKDVNKDKKSSSPMKKEDKKEEKKTDKKTDVKGKKPGTTSTSKMSNNDSRFDNKEGIDCYFIVKVQRIKTNLMIVIYLI